VESDLSDIAEEPHQQPKKKKKKNQSMMSKTPSTPLYELSAKFPVLDPTNVQDPFVIGICGGPSSGKSTVVDILKSKIPANVRVCAFKLSNFYKPLLGNYRRRKSSTTDYEKELEEL
jgi:uridine kinase